MSYAPRIWIIGAVALAGGLIGTGGVRGAITPGGDTTVAATSSSTTIVGDSAAGTLTIDGGSVLNDGLGYVGRNAGGAGIVLVQGTGSTWANSSNLYIGSSGAGSLNVESGGQVSDGWAYLGYYAGASGTVAVSGAGSSWTTTGNLYIGYGGTGTVTVSNGGVVSAGTLYAALSDLQGNGTVNAKGVIADNDVVFDATHGATQTIAFGTGGALKLAVDGTGGLGAGYRASGTLRIADGVNVASSTGVLGSLAGSYGTATVIGAGSQWNVAGPLYVSAGTLTVSDGGQVSAGTLYAPLANVRGNGTINAGGTVLDGDLVFDSTHGTTQAMTFGTGGTLNLTQVAAADLGAGYRGTGSLRIAEGVKVASTKGSIGEGSGSDGTATVTGAGSAWTCSSYLNLGLYGKGALRIDGGATVSNTFCRLGWMAGSSGTATVTGTGSKWTNSQSLTVGDTGTGSLTIQNGGQVSDQYARVGSASGSTGIAVVDGAGSTWTHTNELYVGYSGSGAVTIDNGANVSNTSGYIGYLAGSMGSVIVRGTNSTWTNSDSLMVGRDGNGSLTVSDGGRVTAKALYASSADLAGNGTITVTGGAVLDTDLVIDATHGTSQVLGFGTGGTLNLTISSSADLGVGYKAAGSLRIADGRAITSRWCYLGYHPGSSGTATVSGTGSKWVTSYDRYIGRGGSGTLVVTGGALIDDYHGYIGFGAGSTGAVTISGSASKWTTDFLSVGESGSGTLTVEGGGRVDPGFVYVAYRAGSTGAVVVRGNSRIETWSDFETGEGNATITLTDGGVISAKTFQGAPYELLGNGTMYVRGAVLDANLVFDNPTSVSQVIPFGTGGRLSITPSSGTLGAGHKGVGSLFISNGTKVSSSAGLIGALSGSNGTATVSGTGSEWNAGSVTIGNFGRGTLNVADGARVVASGVSVNGNSALRLHVSGNGMVVLGSTNTAGRLTNDGTLAFYANPLVSPGVYTPFTEFAGRAINWSGSGAYNAFGGTWDNAAKTFTVSPATAIAAGAGDSITPGERLLITDSVSGRRVGASFGSLTGSPSFSASPMTGSEIDALLAVLTPDKQVAAGWNFTTDLAGGSDVLLSYDIGRGYKLSDLSVWRLESGVWSAYTPGTFAYDSNGMASFTVSSFSGYAMAVPEPSLVALAAGSMLLLRRRGRERGRSVGQYSAH